MTMHAAAFNTARRNSIRNEPDLLQENIMDDDLKTPPSSPYTQKQCMDMIDMVCPDSPLPPDCAQFQDVKVALQRKNSNRADHAIAFAGMSPGEAARAAAARERGQLHPAQIQRRMTSHNKRSIW